MRSNVRTIVACVVLLLTGCAQVPQRDYYSYLQYSSKTTPRQNRSFSTDNRSILSAEERALYQKELALREATIQQLRQDLESSRSYINKLLEQLAHLNKIHETNVTGIKNIALYSIIPHSVRHQNALLYSIEIPSSNENIVITALPYPSIPESHNASLYKTSIAMIAYGIADALGIPDSLNQASCTIYNTNRNTKDFEKASSIPSSFTLTATSASTARKDPEFELEFPEVIYDGYSETEHIKENNHPAKPAIYTQSVQILPEENISQKNTDTPFAVSNVATAKKDTSKRDSPINTQQDRQKTPPKENISQAKDTPKINKSVRREETGKTAVQQQSNTHSTIQRVNIHSTAESSHQLTSKKLYDTALDATYNHQYERSRVLFQQFLQTFPTDPLVPNALYWIGETWYSTGNYTKAIECFQNVVQRFPRKPKAPDALLKIAMSYNQLKNTKKMQEILMQLEKQYPQSSALKKAHSLRLM